LEGNKKGWLWELAAENSLLPDALAKPEIQQCRMIKGNIPGEIITPATVNC